MDFSDTFWERVPLVVRLFTAASAVALCVAGVVNLSLPACYTTAVVSLGLIFFAIVAILCEFSPYGLNVLMGVCPLLGEYFFRGFLYIVVGLLPLGKEMSWLGRLSGCLMLLSGASNIGIHLMLPTSVYYYHHPPHGYSYFPQSSDARSLAGRGGEEEEEEQAGGRGRRTRRHHSQRGGGGGGGGRREHEEEDEERQPQYAVE